MADRPPRPLTDAGSRLDIRIWANPRAEQPLLLATTPRKCGTAVERNAFRRRARMALLAVLRDAGTPGGRSPRGFPLVWLRPAKGIRVRDIPYADLEGQLRLAFSRFRA
ncbi:MAG: hypothetical protein U0P81_08415 [Holophagaceae bacterium]